MTRPTTGAFNTEALSIAGAKAATYPTRPGAHAAQLIEHHENWIRDTLLWLPVGTKDAALSVAWLALKTRKGTPTWHDLLDALRVAALYEQAQRKPIHDDDVSFVPYDSDED